MNKLFVIIFLSLIVASCNKQIDAIKPLTKVSAEGELSSLAGIIETTVGNYTLLASSGNFKPYDLPGLNISEGRGNNVTLQQFGPVSKETDAYFFQNSPAAASGYSSDFYRGSFQIIVSVNTTLEGMQAFETGGFTSLTAADKNKFLYAKGENIFLRAFTYFNLIRIYGKPYYQNAATSSGVPIKKSSSISDNPAPSTVKEVYDFIIADLQQAAQLMKAPVTKTNSFANTAAAWSLLSRVYLYMGGTTTSPDKTFNDAAATYADSVIDQSNGKYSLATGADYIKMFGDDEFGDLGKSSFASNHEIIWAYDNAQGGSEMGQEFHYVNYYGSDVGATFLPSANFKSIIAAGDVRGSFLKMNDASGYTETTKWLCLNMAWITYAPNIYFRLGEVYLNRAEASAKAGDFTQARADLKKIHTRAGLPASDIDNLSDAAVLAAVLKERRIELAFEGHSSYDYFRNGLPMTRTAADNNGQAMTIQPDDPKVVFPIPSF
ncbi:RagB/SusD family nutrient uptake outer membrane protein [Pinibacter aurantiacus]|uniref:RagB/SusD family nutrient uptake outer membrane protein n=1 Tax=Pinibacter aurantiacus TaxID=2851599 RepID=A0A9E2W442_9BACT|nr:RagB/SusD family nutrient uptake outer membrane protein [Pinibacter aurantiacus]MBV4359250.1 RagB/SusD family nutrient uptake outer membrane protein [Pinibacter aurantiacus]